MRCPDCETQIVPAHLFAAGTIFFCCDRHIGFSGRGLRGGLSRTISGPHWMRLRFAQSLRTATCCVMPPNVSEDWHLKRVVVGRDSIHFSFFQKEKCGMTQMVFVFLSAVRRRRRTCTSRWRVAVRRSGAAANCAAQRAAGIVNGNAFGVQPAGTESELSRTTVGLRRAEAADCNIHTRQPLPRQKRFRIKGGRGDGALRIGDLLIASKVPKASDSAKLQGRPRNRFTAAVFGATF